MSSFPILPNEAFTFNYNDKRGVELEFRPRKKKKKEEEGKTNTTTIALKGKKDNTIIIFLF
jgi:hypothetical protein